MRKTILDSEFKPSIPKKQGIKVNGLVTALAYKISGKGKNNKEFVNTMVANEQAQYISIRYSPRLVTSLTGLQGDSAQHFIDAHPMLYEFARNASDLEIKAWIREQYRTSQQNPTRTDTTITK